MAETIGNVFDEARWLTEVVALVKKGDALGWAIGDKLNEYPVGAGHGNKNPALAAALTKVAQKTGLTIGTLRILSVTAAKVCASRTSSVYRAHEVRAVAGPAQEKLLAKAEKLEWTTHQLRYAVKNPTVAVIPSDRQLRAIGRAKAAERRAIIEGDSAEDAALKAKLADSAERVRAGNRALRDLRDQDTDGVAKTFVDTFTAMWKSTQDFADRPSYVAQLSPEGRAFIINRLNQTIAIIQELENAKH